MSDPTRRSTPASIEIDDGRLARLRRLNLAAGASHAVSGLLMIALGNGFELPVTTLIQNGPPGTPVDAWTLTEAFTVRIAWATAAFSFLSAAFHFVVASPMGGSAYGSELRHGRNRFRWVEYSLSATLMILLIALITGVTDLAALIAIAFVNAAMIFFGWIMEVANPPGRTPWWTPFGFGAVAGAGPWLALAIYLFVNVNVENGQGPPTFVYGILVTIFVFFNCFAVNQWLQYKRVGRWSDYVFGESAYIVLSLTAKTALAWQIFANTLV